MTEPSADTPFHRPVRLAEIPQAGLSLQVTATAEERQRLAAALGLPGILALDADLSLRRTAAGFDVTGRLAADVAYECVVTLDPFTGRVEEPVEARFAIAATHARPEADEIDFTIDEADPPEPIVNGIADLGPLLVEFLALGLDAYPRKPDAVFEAPDAGEAEDKPFAALAKLKPGEG